MFIAGSTLSGQIVIVDDTKVNIAILKRDLQIDELQIVDFLDPVECSKALPTLDPKLFVLDIEMPGMNGIELAECIQKHYPYPQPPILFFTASLSDQILKKAFEVGCFDFVRKGIPKTELQLRVRNAISYFELQRQDAEQRKMLEIFLKLMFHDIANPVTIIESSLTLAKRTDDQTKIKRFVEHSAKAADNLATLVQDLKAFFQGKNISVETKLLDLKPQIASSHSDSLKMKKLELDFDFRDESLKVAVPASFLNYQIMNNFLTNAIKYSPEFSVIKITFEKEGQSALIKIRDFGAGISESAIDKSMHNAPVTPTAGTKGEQGTGSGMMIAKHFIKNFGGQLNIVSKQKGQVSPSTLEGVSGTEIQIKLPLI
jgi:signal transduction histidine kinase